MTREEEIKNAACTHCAAADVMLGFIGGAEWADRHPKSPWISVEERLPEEGQQILEAYTMECTASGLKSFNEEILFSCYRGKFVCDGKEKNYGIGKCKSTTHHWMPIPQIEKGGEQ